MFRTLTDCFRLMLESPGLMLLGAVVVLVPGGLLLMPVFASRLRRRRTATRNQLATARMGRKQAALIEPVASAYTRPERASPAKSGVIAFVPSAGKIR